MCSKEISYITGKKAMGRNWRNDEITQTKNVHSCIYISKGKWYICIGILNGHTAEFYSTHFILNLREWKKKKKKKKVFII